MADKWSKIEKDYVTGDLSYRKLAAKHKVSSSMLIDKGRAGGWVEKRKQYRANVVSKAIAKAEDKDSDNMASLIRSTTGLIQAFEGVATDPQILHRYTYESRDVERDGNHAEETTVVKEQMIQGVNDKALKALTGALRDLIAAERNVHELPTQAEKEAQRIAAARLNMDERRQQAEQDAAESDKDIKIVIDAGPEAWNE